MRLLEVSDALSFQSLLYFRIGVLRQIADETAADVIWGDKEVLGRFRRSWRTGYAGSGFRWEKSIPKRCGGSRARRENSTARGLEGSEKRARDAARSDGISVRYGLAS